MWRGESEVTWSVGKTKPEVNKTHNEDNNRLCAGLTDCLRHIEKFIKIIANPNGKFQREIKNICETDKNVMANKTREIYMKMQIKNDNIC